MSSSSAATTQILSLLLRYAATNMLESTIQATVKTHVHSTVRQHTGAAHAGISKYRIQSGTEIETQTKTTDVNTKAPCNNGTDVEAKAGSYIAFQRKHICDQPQL